MHACSPILLLALLATSPGDAPVTAAPADAATVSGRVLDARTGAAVAHALVTLEPAGATLVRDGAAGLGRFRSQLTGESGAYRFSDVAPGEYLLRIERLGYGAASVHLDVRRPADAQLSVALEQEPVLLEPVRVEQRGRGLFATGALAGDMAAEDAARISAERVRQELFVAPDSRVLTWTDVVDGVTLGGGDVFRALQRFPGVGTRDDYSAELWTRGASWPHTRVTFDGVPLFNPLHAVGVLSAIAPDILGAVFFHPGVRPSALPGGAAGAVDLQTRPATGDGNVRGAADLSMASAALTLEQRVGGRASWLVTGRRSHLNALQGGLGSLGLDTVDLPFRFHDIAARADVQLTPRVRVEASGLTEEDRLDGDVTGVLERTDARWGNRAGRITLRAHARGLEWSQNIGGSRFFVETEARLVRGQDPSRAWTEPPGSNRIAHALLSGEVAPAMTGSAPPWAVGYDVAWKDVDYHGPLPRVHAVKPDTMRRVTYARSLRVAGVHGEARVRTMDGRLTVNPGARVEAVRSRHGDVLRPAPRVAVRMALTPSHTVSLAVGRSWQHIQALGVAGPSIHPAFHASHFWLWSDTITPALRADLASVGTERWLGHGWIASATLFARRATGLAVPDPAPGRLGGRPLWVPGENRAQGMELGTRRIGARWSAAAGYTLGRSELRAAGLRFASPADRREILDVTAGVRLPLGLRATAAYTAMSGAPFTRAYARSVDDCNDFGFGCDNPTGSWVEEPNAQRTPAYRSVDASLHWARAYGRAELGAYAQVRNVLGRDNASTYAGSTLVGRAQTRDGIELIWDDRFERGLPRLPLAGLRVSVQ